ncbi:hypothetical protein B566_EDAN008847 [Ephemera danica]|nr:hypothetical protein B566_EDAN008847 [Ephemera danica]
MAELECQVCKQNVASSVGELHVHYISQHSPEELSLALLVCGQLLPQSPHSSLGPEDLVLNRALARHPEFLQRKDAEKPVQAKPKTPPKLKRGRKPNPATKRKIGRKAKIPVKELHTNVVTDTSEITGIKKLDDPSAVAKVTRANPGAGPNTASNDSQDVICHIVELKESSPVRTCKVANIATKNCSTPPPSNTVIKTVIDSGINLRSGALKDCDIALHSGTEILTALGLAKRSPQLYQALLRKKPASESEDNLQESKRKKQKVEVKRDVPLLLPAENFTRKFTRSILKTQAPPEETLEGDIAPQETEKSAENPDSQANNVSVGPVGPEDEESNDSVVSKPATSTQETDYRILPRGNERRYLCLRCKNAYKKKSHLDRHIKSHTGERPFACNVCPKRFAVRAVLTQHLRTHTGEKPYNCSVCGLNFKQTSGLMTHMMLHTGKPYKCDVCDKAFVSNHKLVHHSQSHGGTKEYACKSCSSTFFTFSALEQHVRILHSTEKKHVCEICGNSFKLEVSLKVHLDHHIKELGGEDILDQLTKMDDSNSSSEIASV